MARKRIVRPDDVGNLTDEFILEWLVDRGWIWKNALGIYGPDRPPKTKPELETYTMAISLLSASSRIARSGGEYPGAVRFSVRVQAPPAKVAKGTEIIGAKLHDNTLECAFCFFDPKNHPTPPYPLRAGASREG